MYCVINILLSFLSKNINLFFKIILLYIFLNNKYIDTISTLEEINMYTPILCLLPVKENEAS